MARRKDACGKMSSDSEAPSKAKKPASSGFLSDHTGIKPYGKVQA